jgi:hypothetical protein
MVIVFDAAEKYEALSGTRKRAEKEGGANCAGRCFESFKASRGRFPKREIRSASGCLGLSVVRAQPELADYRRRKKRGEEMRASRILANSQLAALLLILLARATASAGDRMVPVVSSHFEPRELSTDCVDREYRGKNAKLGLDYTDLINNCGDAVVITWQSFNDGAPQTEGGGMGQSACIPPGGSVTTASREKLGVASENLPVSVVTCQ